MLKAATQNGQREYCNKWISILGDNDTFLHECWAFGKKVEKEIFFCEKGWQRKRSVSLLKLLSLQNGILMGENE